jgi:hypothetical protein
MSEMSDSENKQKLIDLNRYGKTYPFKVVKPLMDKIYYLPYECYCPGEDDNTFILDDNCSIYVSGLNNIIDYPND